MTDKEKLLETLKVAYEPRKIPQEDGSAAIYYPTDEDVADIIEAKIIKKHKHRAEVAERAFSKLVHEMYEHGIRPMCDEKFFVESRLKDAEKELAEEKKDD